MTFAPGQRFGACEIVAPLGAGGMGEVYRARDTKLNRDVAIKVLLPEVANDADRLARFRREAQVLASLNHPNIAHIHGLEETNGVTALVLEFVDGEDLAQRIARGPIPVDEALPIARQIAEALEAAHDHGIIHRDLKPANIKVTPDGTVKVLDFGLAKALEPAGAAAANATDSPTLSMQATAAGVILGTAAYMAPEQARGKSVDRRADIWAFGCVLFEMLAARRAFRSDDVTDTIVAILSKEPEWQALPAAAIGVRLLIARCLKKEPKQRLQAIGDARIQIDELISGSDEIGRPAAAGAPQPRRRWPTLAAIAAVAVVAVAIAWLARPTTQDRLPARFEIVSPSFHSLEVVAVDRNLAISPDGRYIVYRTGDPEQLVLRAIDRLDGQPLNGTAGARYPFFSPDSRWVGFFAGAALKKVSIAGGPAVTIGPSPIPRGASWGEDGNIVFATTDVTAGLVRVSSSGGEQIVLTRPDTTAGERAHWQMSVLPRGRGVLFTIVALNTSQPPRVAVLDLRSGQIKTLIHGGSHPEYLDTGHLLYAAGGDLMAVPFDLTLLQLRGDPVPVVNGVVTSATSGAANYAVSREGTLVYVPALADAPRSLVWVGRNGRETPSTAPERVYSGPRVSPDGTRVAVVVRDVGQHIHVFDFARETLSQLTIGSGIDEQPIWTADGKHVVFSSQRGGVANLYAQAAAGTGPVYRLTTSPNWQTPGWVAPDGTGIVGSVLSGRTAMDVVWFPIRWLTRNQGSVPESGSSPAEPIVSNRAIDANPDVSPDGRYLAYQSNESGRYEIYVQPFPRVSGGIWQVSTGGGIQPAWARDSSELFYIDSSGSLAGVAVERSAGRVPFGNPVRLFKMPEAGTSASRPYDVAPDGRFLMLKETGAGDRNREARRMVVVLNWTQELKAKWLRP